MNIYLTSDDINTITIFIYYLADTNILINKQLPIINLIIKNYEKKYKKIKKNTYIDDEFVIEVIMLLKNLYNKMENKEIGNENTIPNLLKLLKDNQIKDGLKKLQYINSLYNN